MINQFFARGVMYNVYPPPPVLKIMFSPEKLSMFSKRGSFLGDIFAELGKIQDF